MPKIYSKTFCMIPNSPFCILHIHRKKNVVMKVKISEIKRQHFGTMLELTNIEISYPRK